MHIFASCTDAITHCLETKTFAIAHLFNREKTMDMHIHDCHEIYYAISGGKQFLIGNTLYDFKPGDIFFINSFESHHLLQVEQPAYERIVIQIHPEYLKMLSTNQTDLCYCFSSRDAQHRNRRSLTPNEQNRFLYFIHELSTMSQYGQDILDTSAFLKMMVFLNEIFSRNELAPSKKISVSGKRYEQFNDILSYINQHLSEDLTIQTLANYFYLSPSYLCKIFKQEAGTTINKYITTQRISLAKSLLTEGYSVTDVCSMCGFGDYSNFLKTFTKIVGITPKKYSQFSLK